MRQGYATRGAVGGPVHRVPFGCVSEPVTGETVGMRIRGAAFAVVLALVAMGFPHVARADAPTPTWTTTIGFDVRSGSVAVDPAGNTYVAGSRGVDPSVAVLRKFDPDGAALWTRSWAPPGVGAHADGHLVAVAPDGSVYFAGTVGSHYEGGAWFLRKYGADGTLRWARDERGWQHGRTADFPTGLAVTDHQVLLSGSFQGCCGDLRILDGWVLAFGRDGSWRWRSPFEAAGLGAFSDEAESIAVGAGGGIYVGGWAAVGPEADDVAADHELFLQRLDLRGHVVWSRVYPDTAHIDQHFGADLAVRGRALMVSALVDGIPVAFTRSRPGHAWLGRFTLGGSLVWSRRWGTSWTRAAQPTAVTVDGAGRTFVVGTRRDPSDHGLDAFVRKYSSAGDLVWTLPLQQGQRLMLGGDVAWRHGALFVTAEAVKTRIFGAAVEGYLWMFT